jgi:hypothetical protein
MKLKRRINILQRKMHNRNNADVGRHDGEKNDKNEYGNEGSPD